MRSHLRCTEISSANHLAAQRSPLRWPVTLSSRRLWCVMLLATQCKHQSISLSHRLHPANASKPFAITTIPDCVCTIADPPRSRRLKIAAAKVRNFIDLPKRRRHHNDLVIASEENSSAPCLQGNRVQRQKRKQTKTSQATRCDIRSRFLCIGCRHDNMTPNKPVLITRH